MSNNPIENIENTIFQSNQNIEQSNKYGSNVKDIQDRISIINDSQMKLSSLIGQYTSIHNSMKVQIKNYQPTEHKNVFVETVVDNDDYDSTFLGNYKNPSGTAMEMIDNGAQKYDIDSCKAYAVEHGKDYFGLQSGYFNTGMIDKGFNNTNLQCSVGDDYSKAIQEGESNVNYGLYGNPPTENERQSDGNMYGGGWINAIYETSGTSPSYLGIFGDGPFRRMTWNNVWRDFDGCIDYAKENKSKYMGFQCGNQESGVAACMISNDIEKAVGAGDKTMSPPGQSWGKPIVLDQSAPPCTIATSYVDKNGIMMGGGMTNAIYEIPDPNDPPKYMGNYFDAPKRALPINPPNGKGNTHSVETCNKAAGSKGYKYFAVQDGKEGTSQCFMGNDWSQATQYGLAEPWGKDSKGRDVGGSWTNAVYKIDYTSELPKGDPSKLGKLGYVGKDGDLREYSSSMYNVANNIPTIDNTNGCPKDYEGISSVQWNEYKRGMNMGPSTTCGLAKEFEPEKQKMRELQVQMQPLVDTINTNIQELKEMNVNLNVQSGINKELIDKNLNLYEHINMNIDTEHNDITKKLSGILNDTSNVVVYNNYHYLIWFFLVIVAVIIIFIMSK
jgi:predicted transcriptional regulator|tara:strand:+ start:2540 stop:4375 length:1836 start_codon:yes stop_codon:yes gene_type:complete